MHQQRYQEALRDEWNHIENITNAHARNITAKRRPVAAPPVCFEGGEQATGEGTFHERWEAWTLKFKLPKDLRWLRVCARDGLNRFVRGTTTEPPYSNNPALDEKRFIASLANWHDKMNAHRDVSTDGTGATAATDPDADTFSEEDIAKPIAKSTRIGKASLYIPDVYVCRYAPTRGRPHQRYRVEQAVVDIVLSDTGAAPSYATTSLLEKMPRDAVIDRQPEAPVSPIDGPDGKSLETYGTAVLLLDVQGMKVRQEVIVGAGAPILILGNDFLDSYKAVISMNVDNVGGAEAVLSTDRGKRTIKLSTNAATLQVASLTPSPTHANDDSTAASYDGKADRGATGATAGAYTVEPLPTLDKPAGKSQDFTNKQLQVVNPERYFLHTGEAVHIPARSKATLWLACPKDLEQDKVREYYIDRLPVQEGMSHTPPVVIPSFVNPNRHGLIPVVVWNRKRRAITIPSFTATATLEVGYEAV